MIDLKKMFLKTPFCSDLCLSVSHCCAFRQIFFRIAITIKPLFNCSFDIYSGQFHCDTAKTGPSVKFKIDCGQTKQIHRFLRSFVQKHYLAMRKFALYFVSSYSFTVCELMRVIPLNLQSLAANRWISFRRNEI